jgi:cyclin-dependent kinase regulatory subunit CKS1
MIRSLERPEYSEKFFDEENEYRYVMIPREMAQQIKNSTFLKEDEWRSLGISQSRGWQHAGMHK